MKVRQLIGGIASGYAYKAVLLASTLFLVPFFLRESVFGIEGYGTIFAILAYVNVLALFTGPLYLSFSRTISSAVGEIGHAGRCDTQHPLGTGLKVLLGACGVLTGATILWRAELLGWIGLEPTPDAQLALALAAASYAMENGLILFRVPLITRGEIAFVNGVLMLEAAFRAVAFLVVFTLGPAAIAHYFAVQLGFVALRQLALFGRLRIRFPEDLRGSVRAPWLRDLRSLRYSLSVTALTTSDMLVERIPVLLASRFFGPAESGYVALTIHTIRGNVLQAFSTVLQPIAVPVAARLDPRRMATNRVDFLWSLEAAYTIGVGGAIALLIVVLPRLIEVWIGSEFQQIVFPAQLLLGGCAVDLAFALRRALLTGQGLLGFATRRLLSLVVVYVLLMTVVLGHGSWWWVVIGAAAFSMLVSIFAIARVFADVTAVDGARRVWRPVGFNLAIASLAIFLSRFANLGWLELAGAATVVVAGVLALGHVLLTPLDRALRTVTTLLHSSDRSMFEES